MLFSCLCGFCIGSGSVFGGLATTHSRSIRSLAVLQLHLLTGAQRIAQLVALETENVKHDTITLMDGKGRPGRAPRPHCVPLIQAAVEALRELRPEGHFAISTAISETKKPRKADEKEQNKGKTHLGPTTLSGWAQDAVGDAVCDFQTKRLRSGVETLLASVKVSDSDRGRLQSHGISGVQNRHYDGHKYMDEKRDALEKLFQLLEDTKQTVTG